MALHPFIKAAGLKSQAAFDKKYPTEEHFFSEFPHLKPKAAMGMEIEDPQMTELKKRLAQYEQIQPINQQTPPTQQPITNEAMLGQGQPIQLNTNQFSQNWNVQNENSPETMQQVYAGRNRVQPITPEQPTEQAPEQSQGFQGMSSLGMGMMGAAKQVGAAIGDTINALPSIISAIAPDNHRVRNKPLTLGYDPYTYGTGSRAMFANGGFVQGNDGVQVENDQIQPLSNSFSVLTGASHQNGGVDLAYNGNVVEGQGGEPLSKDSAGDLTLWGKMRNPISNKLFENDAKDLAKEENKIMSLTKNSADIDPQIQPLKFNTQGVLADAQKIKLSELNNKKEIYSEMQNTILQIAKDNGKNPKSLSNKITIGKDGCKMPKMGSGGKLAKYKQYDPETAQVLEDNYDNLLWEGIVPLNTLAGQKSGKNNTFGDAYNTQVDKFNTIRKLQGQEPINNARAYQDAYNQEFLRNTGQSFFQGNTPAGIDGKMGNKTSSTPFFRGRFNGNKQASLTADQIAKMSDTDFAAISGSNKADFFKNNQNLGATWQYDFTGQMEAPQTVNKQVANTYQPQQLQGVGTQPIPTEYDQTADPNQIVPNTYRPSLADRNKFNFASIIPEVAAALDKPDFVQGQQFTPDLLSPYRVSFQDQINQNQNTFSQVERSLRNNPEALSTLAANTYDANNRVQAQEFRTNQEIANQTANQNTSILNDAKKTNISLQDLQADRQAQAKANTDFNRQNALNSISSKFLQNKAENNKIRLMENFSNYRTDETGTLENFNNDPNFNYSGGNQIESNLKRSDFKNEKDYQAALLNQQRLQLQTERLQMDKQKQAQKISLWNKRRR